MSVSAVVFVAGLPGEIYSPTTRGALALSAVGLVGLSPYLPGWLAVMAILLAFVCAVLIVFASSTELSSRLTNDNLTNLDYLHLTAATVLGISSVFALGGLYVLLAQVLPKLRPDMSRAKIQAMGKKFTQQYGVIAAAITFAILISMPIFSLRVLVESLRPTAKLIQDTI